MNKLLGGLLLFYLLAMHASMALMEIASWSLFLCAVIYQFGKKRDFRDFPLWPPLLILTLTVLVSLFATEQLKPWVPQFGFMRWVLLLYSTYWAFRAVWSSKFERRLVRTWSTLILITGSYAVFQALTGWDPAHPGRAVVDPQGPHLWKATGFFSMSLTFAYLIGTSTFAAMAVAWNQPPRGLGRMATAAGFLGVVASMSRGAWIGALVSGFVYVSVKARRLVPWFIVSVVLAVMGLAQFSEGFAKKIRGLLTMTIDHSSSVRLELWRSYWEMFKDHPWLGVGIFEGDKYLPEYYQRLGIDEKFTSHAHNVLLQWLAGSGPLALLCYLFIAGTMMKLALRIGRSSPWGWSLFLAQLFFHIGGLTEANFFDGEVNHMIVFLWALTLALYHVA